MGIPEEQKETKEIFGAIKTENVLKLVLDSKPQIKEAQRTWSKINYKNKNKQKATARPIILKLQKVKDKEKSLKRSQRQHLIYRGVRIRITSNFSSEIMQTRKEWSEIYKVLGGKQRKKN